jgi:hypothetical protein
MPLNLYLSIAASGVIPRDWVPVRGGTIKYPVRNKRLLAYLRRLAAGRWRKIIKAGDTGDAHYFEHASGKVAGVKFYPREDRR